MPRNIEDLPPKKSIFDDFASLIEEMYEEAKTGQVELGEILEPEEEDETPECPSKKEEPVA